MFAVLLVSDRVSLMCPRQGLLHGKPQKKRVCFVPNRHSGSSSIRVRILKGTREKPASIPLDRSGIRFPVQERPKLFEDYQSIVIEFETKKGKLSPFQSRPSNPIVRTVEN